MSSGFWSRDASPDAWFRMGRLEVSTTVFVVMLGAVFMILSVFLPFLPSVLGYAPSLLFYGEVWRIVTWPMADGIGLWPAINLFFLWYFGRELEITLGRRRMARLYLGIWASLTVAVSLVGLIDATAFIAGLNLVNSWFCCCGSPNTPPAASSSTSPPGVSARSSWGFRS